MSLPTFLSAAQPPAPRDWDMLPNDSATLILTPAEIIDCTDCTIEAIFVDNDGAQMWASEAVADWIVQSDGSLRVDVPPDSVAELAPLVSVSVPSAVAGQYRVTIVSASGDERRTVALGAIRIRYAVMLPAGP